MKKILNQVIKFMVIGGIGTVINLGILFAMTDLVRLWYISSAVVANAASVTSNFLGNKIWTFKNRIRDKKGIGLQYAKYVMSNTAGIILQISLLFVFVHFFLIWYVASAVISIFIAFVLNFFLSKYWAFK